MIRRYAMKKLSITTLALIVILLYALFPVKEKDVFEKNVTYIDNEKLDYVYLNDRYDYLTLSMIDINAETEEEKLKEKLEILIKNGKYKDKIPKHFNAVIPENTKINSLTIKDNVVTVDFSKEILNVTKETEEKMIESIIFTLTENSSVNSVVIKVDGGVLDKLPNSKTYLPSPLTRKYGINKKYEINSLNNINCTTIFYMNEIDEETYYTPVSLFTNDTRDKVSIIIDELKSTSVYQDTLKSYLDANVSLTNYEEVDNIMYLVFNEGINTNLNEDILESVKYTISASIKENYDVDDVIFKVKDSNWVLFL